MSQTIFQVSYAYPARGAFWATAKSCNGFLSLAMLASQKSIPPGYRAMKKVPCCNPVGDVLARPVKPEVEE